jgi:uncharacterized OsmC-like protein
MMPSFTYNGERIRSAHRGRIAAYEEDPKPLTVSAEIRAINGQLKEARSRQFVIQSDEGPIVGGNDEAPSPLTYFVASIGFAVLTDLVRSFALYDLAVDELSLTIRADFPLGAKYAGLEIGSEAESVSYEVEIETPEVDERVRSAISWTEKHCHAVNTIRRPVRVDAVYRVNGAVLES